jgi:two-component system sensor histidine kinase KdpD
MAAGVGKTYRMLSEGQRRKARGTDVVIGFVEFHDRIFTQNQADGLEIIPRKKLTYKDKIYEEMDMEKVFERHPEVLLVDELAHTNIKYSGNNEKRYQDILEILTAGIDVITTLNVQHIESIADTVEEISQVTIDERVPDWVLQKADQIELVDSSPEQLRRRMLHGNIYPQDKINQALTNFFKTSNLLALRELALRFVADNSDEKLLEKLKFTPTNIIYDTNERIAAVFLSSQLDEDILRRAARLATRIKAPLYTLIINNEESLSMKLQQTTEQFKQLSEDLNSSFFEFKSDNLTEVLIKFCLENQITQIVIGYISTTKFNKFFKSDRLLKQILNAMAQIKIDVHIISHRESKSANLRVVDSKVKELNNPELNKPELDKPELDKPELDKPELDKPES